MASCPDAAQRFFSGALLVAFWIAALRSNARALQRVRDTSEVGGGA